MIVLIYISTLVRDNLVFRVYKTGERTSLVSSSFQEKGSIYPGSRVGLISGLGLMVVLLLFYLAPLGLAAQGEDLSERGLSNTRVWIGADGKLLPFKTDEEILEFLRTADVVSIEDIPVGVTKPKKVLLEKDGIRMNSAFRHLDVFKKRWKTSRGLKINFRDSYLFEVAAYKLSRMLGLDNIPPVVVREIEGKEGSLQAWVEQSMTERTRSEKDIDPPSPMEWMYQHQIMRLFDNLIFNDDRNKGNILIDKDWKLWMIDATRAFRPTDELKNEKTIRYCERTVWERLQAMDEEQVKESLDDYLGTFELRTLLKRRKKLIEHVQSLIEDRGEEVVLFELKGKS